MTIEAQADRPKRRSTVRGRKLNRVLGIELPRVTDARSSEARLFRRLATAYVSALGGEGALSALDRAQVADLCTNGVKLAELRKAVLNGRDVPADELVRLSSENRRIFNDLRARTAKAKPAGDPLKEHLARHYGATAG